MSGLYELMDGSAGGNTKGGVELGKGDQFMEMYLW